MFWHNSFQANLDHLEKKTASELVLVDSSSDHSVWFRLTEIIV